MRIPSPRPTNTSTPVRQARKPEHALASQRYVLAPSHVPRTKAAPRLLSASFVPAPQTPVCEIATQAPAPPWLKVGFTALTCDNATIRTILGEGRPFAEDVDTRLRELLGAPLTAGGLESLFTQAWPTASWVCSYEEVEEGSDAPRFTLSALDRRGKIMFDVTILFWRAPDGALDMHAAGAHVSREHRGYGITAYAEAMRARILQAFSDHPQTRLSLQAANAVNANTGEVQEPSGFYLHALRGYLLAESQDVPQLPAYQSAQADGPAKPSELTQLAEGFTKWAQSQMPGISREACAAFTAHCKQPHDYTSLRYGGQAVGAGYLLSGQAPAWYGVQFVNLAKNSAADDTRAKKRQEAQAIWTQQLAHETQSAEARLQGLRQKLWTQVNASDADTRAAGYVGLGLNMHDHPALRDFFVQRQAQEQAARPQAALREGLAYLRGERIDTGLLQASQDLTRTEAVRDEMAQRLAARSADG